MCLFYLQILATLKILPITNKTILKDSKILAIVQRLSEKETAEESSGQVMSSTPPASQANSSTPPASQANSSTPPLTPREKPTSILTVAAKEAKLGKKKVKFALEEASSSDNESRTSNSDTFSDIVVSELYTDFDSPSTSESPKKRLRSSKKQSVSELCRQVIDKHDAPLEMADSEMSESLADSSGQEQTTQEHEIDSTENDDKPSPQENSAMQCLDSETTVTAADSSDNRSEARADSVDADSSSSSKGEISYTEAECDSSEPKDTVASMAEDLLQLWSDLKVGIRRVL